MAHPAVRIAGPGIQPDGIDLAPHGLEILLQAEPAVFLPLIGFLLFAAADPDREFLCEEFPFSIQYDSGFLQVRQLSPGIRVSLLQQSLASLCEKDVVIEQVCALQPGLFCHLPQAGVVLGGGRHLVGQIIEDVAEPGGEHPQDQPVQEAQLEAESLLLVSVHHSPREPDGLPGTDVGVLRGDVGHQIIRVSFNDDAHDGEAPESIEHVLEDDGQGGPHAAADPQQMEAVMQRDLVIDPGLQEEPAQDYRVDLGDRHAKEEIKAQPQQGK